VTDRDPDVTLAHLIDDELGTEPSFRLTDLHAIHDRERHPLEIRGVLGDGVLLGGIPVFARLRRAVLGYGYRFLSSRETNGINQIFPVMELAAIYDSKTIPYLPTSAAMESLLERRSDLRFVDIPFSEMCSSNHVHHESAHALFYELGCAQGMPRDKLLVEMLLGAEAFAMALERYVALLPVSDRRSTALFLALGSYSTPLERAKHSEKLGRAGMVYPDRLGELAHDHPREVLQFLTFSFLLPLLRPGVGRASPGLVHAFAQIVGLPETDEPELTVLLTLGLYVDPEFLLKTQQDFFGFLGLGAQLEAIRTDPLEEMLSSGSRFHTNLTAAVNVVFDPTADGLPVPPPVQSDPTRSILPGSFFGALRGSS
jgi:hypothetical protein